ncbi:MAG: glutaredoxin family protein [Pseudomonadota bacterium]
MNAKIKSAIINIALMAITIAAAIAIGSQAPKLYQQWKGHGRTGDFSVHVANQPERLTLYGTTTCQYCAMARAYLKKEGIPFNDRVVDTSKEANALFAQLNEGGVPVLVSEKKLISGFAEKEYGELAKAIRQ